MVKNIVELVNIQKLLKEERQKRLMTYEDVGNALGCSASYVFRIEKGKRKKPSYEIVSKMINVFELSDSDLNKYIDGDIALEVNKVEESEKDIINFIKKMDVNDFSQVNLLLQQVKEYQNLSVEQQVPKATNN